MTTEDKAAGAVSIGQNKGFEQAAKALHTRWTPEDVHGLIDIADTHSAHRYEAGFQAGLKHAHQPALPDLRAVIHWLEGGCDPVAAAQELRTYQKHAGQAPAAVIELRQPAAPFQQRVQPWLMECFGATIAGDREERNHRFLEEALELVQACGCTASEAHQLVDYVFGRDVGEKAQEVGGVMVTLAALCLAQGIDMHSAGETELARIWAKVESIRAKQAAKPKHGPLPVAPAETRGDSWITAQVARHLDIQFRNGVTAGWNAGLGEDTEALARLKNRVGTRAEYGALFPSSDQPAGAHADAPATRSFCGGHELAVYHPGPPLDWADQDSACSICGGTRVTFGKRCACAGAIGAK